jgi:hypothetical protein
MTPSRRFFHVLPHHSHHECRVITLTNTNTAHAFLPASLPPLPPPSINALQQAGGERERELEREEEDKETRENSDTVDCQP